MADVIAVRYENWDRVKRDLTKERAGALLRKHVALATNNNAHTAQKAIRAKLKSSVEPPNAGLTIALKGSQKTLVDKGELFQSVAIGERSWDRVEIGVHRKGPKFDLAKLLHNGTAIKVTDAMRTMFFYLWLASEYYKGRRTKMPSLSPRAAELFDKNKDWYPLGEETTAIIIPGRPFLKEALEDPAIARKLQDRWHKAVDAAYAELAGKK